MMEPAKDRYRGDTADLLRVCGELLIFHRNQQFTTRRQEEGSFSV